MLKKYKPTEQCDMLERDRRLSKDPNYASNAEFVKKMYTKEIKPAEMSSYINNTKNRFIKSIMAYDSSLLDGMQNPSLQQLHGIIVKNGIKVKSNLKSSEIPKDEVEALKSEFKLADDKAAIAKWKQLRSRYVKKLTAAGQKLSDETLKSLQQLKSLANEIDISIYDKEKAWKAYEKEVMSGTQKFLDSGIIVVDNVPLEKDTCKVSQAGGALQSDIEVKNLHNGKHFFIECKLDFETSQYFKYGVKIQGGNVMYDHKRYVSAAKKNDEDVKKIDELFTKCIDFKSFIKDILETPEVKKSWKVFAQNIDELCWWLQNGDKFDGTAYREWLKNVKPYMMKLHEAGDQRLSFKTGNYPENFKDITAAFDKYIKYYVDGYNDLVKYMVENMPDELSRCYKLEDGKAFKADDLMIPHQKMSHGKQMSSNDLFQYAARMQANAQAHDDVADDFNASMQDMHDDDGKPLQIEKSGEIKRIAMLMQKIEAKLVAVLKSLKKDVNDFDALFKLEEKDKLKYFFKAFVSSVGRKTDGKHPVLDALEDKMGNMVICAPVVVENSRLAQMITDFYVKKDRCAYIQIEDRAYVFDEKMNPLGLEDMPVFKDSVTKFQVALLVNDSLDSIRLSVTALKPGSSAYAGKQKLSFVPKHQDFICKTLKKPIKVHVK